MSPISNGPQNDDDVAFARLVATDPASAANPDLARIRAAVDQAISLERRAASGAPARWLRVLAASITVVAVGATGYLIGNAAGRGNAAESSATTSSAETSGAAASIAPGWRATIGDPGGQAANRGSGLASDAASQAVIPVPFGRNVFVDGGVDGAGGTAEAFAYDPGALTQQIAQNAAAVFGITGSAVASADGWQLGSADYTGATFWLAASGAGAFAFNDPTAVPGWSCTTDSANAAVTEPAKPDCSPVNPDLAPQAPEAALQRARELLTALGVDPASVSLVATPAADGTAAVSVQGGMTADGAVTDPLWYFGFYGDRLSYASGNVAPLISLGAYPTISAAEAVARLNDPRFAAAGPMLAANSPAVDSAATIASGPDAIPAAGQLIPWPVTEVTITQATLGLQQDYLSDGSVLLVPTYSLLDANGGRWTVVAVAEGALDFALK